MFFARDVPGGGVRIAVWLKDYAPEMGRHAGAFLLQRGKVQVKV